MSFNEYKINEKEQQHMSFILYHDPNGILAAIFSHMPLVLKQHCVKVGAVSGLISENTLETSIPKGMTRNDYANAVRYGGFYHDLGAYLALNEWENYPEKGKMILENEISKNKVAHGIRKVILEVVGCCEERCDGTGYPNRLLASQIPLHAGICSVANIIDNIVDARRNFSEKVMVEIEEYIRDNAGIVFLPEAVDGFMKARGQILNLYRIWQDTPPLWKHDDLKPVSKPYDKAVFNWK